MEMKDTNEINTAEIINIMDVSKKKSVKRRRRKGPEKKILHADEKINAKLNNAPLSNINSAKNERIFEIDNKDLPIGLPPVEPLVKENTNKNRNKKKYGKENKNKDREGKAPEDKIAESSVSQKITNSLANPGKKNKAPKPSSINEDAIMELISNTLTENGIPMTREALVERTDAAQFEVESVLLKMLESGKIFMTRKHKYALAEQMGYLSGILQTTSKGFGFLLCNDGDDIFIAQNNMNGALNGDEIVARLLEGRGTSKEGEVVSISKHANTQIVGMLKRVKNQYVVIPDSQRLSGEFLIEKGKLNGAKEGQKVVAMVNYSEHDPVLRIKEVIGYPDEAGTDLISILRAHNIAEEFPRHVLNSARAINQSVSGDDIARREDIRALQTVTIDGADSKDFDDAVSCEMLGNGNYLLGVHIADVSQYVKENGAIDKEAQRRATSIYYLDKVVPMLPIELSNGICSLNPHVDRLTLSCFMEIDERGKVVSHRLSETVMCSHERLVYEDVTAALEGDKGLQEQYKNVMPMLRNMDKLSGILRSRRTKRGSIDFDLPESKIKVNEDGHPTNIGIYERGISNKMIEEFMLICNETVAEYMAYLERPMLYRVHEVPDDEKIRELNVFLGGFGLGLRGAQKGLKPKSLQTVLEKTKDRPGEAVISRVVLRSLRKARYSEENLGHFGLAADHYCHFTSPIRRYPDLEVHRIVKEMIKGQLNEKRQEAYAKKLPELAQHCSERERSAMELEREVDDLKKCEYMSEHIGEVFKGVISGVTNFGIFVELSNTCEGMARLADIEDDYYDYDEKNYRVIGRHHRKIYRLGDNVDIEVIGADITAKRVEFKILREAQPSGRRPRKTKTR